VNDESGWGYKSSFHKGFVLDFHEGVKKMRRVVWVGFLLFLHLRHRRVLSVVRHDGVLAMSAGYPIGARVGSNVEAALDLETKEKRGEALKHTNLKRRRLVSKHNVFCAE